MLVYTFIPNTWEVEAVRSLSLRSPELHGETLSQEKKNEACIFMS